ncbi:hypothetical protein EHS17_15805, partial [Rhodobacteraceae bacterium CH30]
AGCSTYAVPRYSVSADTVAALRSIGNVKVDVGAFVDAEPKSANDRPGELMCRAVGPIKTPDGETYAEYVRKALISELIIADIYDDNGSIELTGKIAELDFDSTGGTWSAGLDLESSNGQKLSVRETYKYQTSFYGETACNQTAQAGLGAIQEAIKSAVMHKDFRALVTAK